MRIFSGIFIAVAFLLWFIARWHHTKNLKQAGDESLPGLFFIGAWLVIYYVI